MLVRVKATPQPDKASANGSITADDMTSLDDKVTSVNSAVAVCPDSHRLSPWRVVLGRGGTSSEPTTDTPVVSNNGGTAMLQRSPYP